MGVNVRPMIRTLVSAFAVVLVLACAVGPAVAQPAGGAVDDADRATFDALMSTAADARKAGRHQEALEALLKAYNLYPNPTLLFNVAKLYQDKGECSNALVYYVKAHEGLAGTSSPKLEALKAALHTELVGFQCADDEAETLKVLGAAVTTLPVAEPLMRLGDLATSSHQCELARSAYLRATEVAPSGSEIGGRAVSALAGFECTEEAAASGEPASGSGGEGVAETPVGTYVAWGLLAAGGVALVGGVAMDVVTAGRIDDFETAAEGGEKAQYDTAKSDAESGQLTTLILYLTSGALVAAGVTTWLVTDEPASTDTAFRVRPAVSADGSARVVVEIPLP